jgi:hypothetical protein
MGLAMRRAFVSILYTLICAAATCGAQSRDSAVVGARVRVTLSDSLRQWSLAPRTQALIGTVIALNADVLMLTIGAADTMRISRSHIRGLAVSRGTSRLRSAVAQAAFGAFLGSVLSDRKLPRWAVVSVGAGLGVVVGSLAPFEHWRRVRW